MSKTVFSVSNETPETIDTTGFERLEFTEVGSITDIDEPKSLLTLSKVDIEFDLKVGGTYSFRTKYTDGSTMYNKYQLLSEDELNYYFEGCQDGK